jgi:hypothetical protein
MVHLIFLVTLQICGGAMVALGLVLTVRGRILEVAADNNYEKVEKINTQGRNITEGSDYFVDREDSTPIDSSSSLNDPLVE